MKPNMDRVVLPISENEAEERRRFINWFTTNFVYKKNREYKVPGWEIADLYKSTFPSSNWYDEDIILLLHQTGYMTPKEPAMNISPNFANLSLIECGPFVEKLLKIDWDEKTMTLLRKLTCNTVNTLTGVDEIMGVKIEPFAVFLDLWCLDTRREIAKHLVGTSQTKAIIGDIKRTYHKFCSSFGLPEKRWAELREYLERQGHTSHVGYANKKSGQSYMRYLYVPGCDEDELTLAADMGQMIVRLADGDYLTDGTPVDITDAERNEQNLIKRLKALSILQD